MKAPLALAFLCILALCYLAWSQQQEIVMLAEEVGDLMFKVGELKPKGTKRGPDGKFAKKEPS